MCFKYAAQQMISQGKGGCLIGLSLRFRLQFRLDSLLVAASSVAGRKGMGYLLPSNSCPRTKSFVGQPPWICLQCVKVRSSRTRAIIRYFKIFIIQRYWDTYIINSDGSRKAWHKSECIRSGIHRYRYVCVAMNEFTIGFSLKDWWLLRSSNSDRPFGSGF